MLDNNKNNCRYNNNEIILGNNHHGENHKIMLRRCYKYLKVEQYQQGLVTLELYDYAACMGVVYKKFVLYMNF